MAARVGRVSHPALQPGNVPPVAPSALPIDVKVFTESGFQPAPAPRALEIEEIPGLVEQFRHAAVCARQAGFDGVELHAAGGYVLDQFLRDGANHRADRYGGSLENRCRLLLEVLEAVQAVVGRSRVGVRIAPVSTPNGVTDSDPERLFSYLVDALNEFGPAYLHVIEVTVADLNLPIPTPDFDLQILRRAFNGPYMASYGYDRARAIAAIAEGRADLVAFGRPFIANPDLVERLRVDAPLAVADPARFYGGGAEGYIDYPPMEGGLADHPESPKSKN
jgi:N-ethylmaleimide reductase